MTREHNFIKRYDYIPIAVFASICWQLCFDCFQTNFKRKISKMLRNLPKDTKLCRICLEDEKFSVSVFCEYSQKLNVNYRIKKYYNIEIFKNDDLPKHICYNCLSNLKTIETHVESALKKQNLLKKNPSERTFLDDQCFQEENRKPRRNSVNFFLNNSNSEELFEDAKQKRSESDGEYGIEIIS